MPDPTRSTISATEMPALFKASPYVTEWMLWQKFAHGREVEKDADNRMDWGKRLQPALLAKAAEDLKLEVRPNAADTYVRSGFLGCTRDAEIICPDRGPGTLETKVVFDYGVWMREWNGGKTPPRHNEIQLQQQMKVGDGPRPYTWGVLGAMVCGDMVYFEREPIKKLWTAMDDEAARFFESVRCNIEPQPFGDPVETPLLRELYPPIPELELDLSELTRENLACAELVRMLKWHSEEKSGHEKAAKSLNAKIQAMMLDAAKLKLPYGIACARSTVNRKAYSVEASSYVMLKPYVPDVLPEGAIEALGEVKDMRN